MKSILTIQEVSEKLRVSKHTLRFWEKEFEGYFVPLRTSGGQRRYTQEHLSMIMKIKMLKGKGQTLAQIKDIFNLENKNEFKKIQYIERIEEIANEVAEVVRSTVYEYLQNVSKK